MEYARGGPTTMTTAACEACGEQNPQGTQFCLRCHAFLAWEEPGPSTGTGPAGGLVLRPAGESMSPLGKRTDQAGRRA